MFAAYRTRRGGLYWRLLALFIAVISVTLTQANFRGGSNIGKADTNVTNEMTGSAIADPSNGSVRRGRNNTQPFASLLLERVNRRGINHTTQEDKSFISINTTFKESNRPKIRNRGVANEEKFFVNINITPGDGNHKNVSVLAKEGGNMNKTHIKDYFLNETHHKERVSSDDQVLSTTTKTSLATFVINGSNNVNVQLVDANRKLGEEILQKHAVVEPPATVKPRMLLLVEKTDNERQATKIEVLHHKEYGIRATESSVTFASLETNTKQILTDNAVQQRSIRNYSTTDATTSFPLTNNELKVSFPQRRSVKENSISSNSTPLSSETNFSSKVKFTEVDIFKNTSTFHRRDSTHDLLMPRNVSSEYIFECPRYCSCFVLTSRLRCRGPWATSTTDSTNHRCKFKTHSNCSTITQTNNSPTGENVYPQPSTNNVTITQKNKQNNFLPFRMKELGLQQFFIPVLNLSVLMRAFENHFIVKKLGEIQNSSTAIIENNTQLSTTSTKSSTHSNLHGIQHEVVHVVYNPNSLTNPISIFIGEGRRLQYQKLEHITDLTIRDCNVTRIARKTLGAFPNLVRLDLSSNAVTHIHPHSFLGLSHLTRLDLSKNSIRNISRAFVHLSSLEVLNLQSNLLTSLNSDTFIGLSKITYLNLGHNLIANVDIAAFQHLRSLTTLVLSDNPLSSLVRLNFFGSKLQYIDMSNIKIDKVPQVITQSIKNLRVSGNNLRTIQRGDLDAYPYLGELDLEKNGLEILEEDALGRHEYLTRLFMGNNHLKEVPQSLPISLTELYLQMNQINALRVGDFIGLSSLEQLFLFDNNISYVSDTALTDLLNLRTLSLRTNRIQTLGSNIFSKLSKLSSLDLSENPISSLGGGVFVGLRHLQVLHLTFIRSLKIAISVDVFNPLQALEVLNLERSPSLCEQILNSTEMLKSLSSLREIYLVRCNLTQLPVNLRTLLPRLQEVKLIEDNNVTSKNVTTRRPRSRKATKRSLADTNRHKFSPRSYQGNGDGGKGEDAGNDTAPKTVTGTGSNRAIVGSSLPVTTLGQRKDGDGTDRETKKKVGRGKFARTGLESAEKRLVDPGISVKEDQVKPEIKATTRTDVNGNEYFGKYEIHFNNAGDLEKDNFKLVRDMGDVNLDFEAVSRNRSFEKVVGYDNNRQGNAYSVAISSQMPKRSHSTDKTKQGLEIEKNIARKNLSADELSHEKQINNQSNLLTSEMTPSEQPRESTKASVTQSAHANLHLGESYHGTTTLAEPLVEELNEMTVPEITPNSHNNSASTDIQTRDLVLPTATVPTGVTKRDYNTLITDISSSTAEYEFRSVLQSLVTEISIPREVIDMPMNDDSKEQDLDSGITEIGVEKLMALQTQKSPDLRSQSTDAGTTLTGGLTGSETSSRTYPLARNVPSTPFKKQLDWIQVKPTIHMSEETKVPFKHIHKIVRKQMHQPTMSHSHEQLGSKVADNELQILTGSNTRENQNDRLGESSSEETNFFGGSESGSENFFDPNNEKPDIEVIEQKATKNIRKYEYDSETKQIGNTKNSVKNVIPVMDDSETNIPKLTTLSENSSEVHINRDTYLFRGDSRYEIHNIMKHAKHPDTGSGGIVEEVDGHVHFNKIFDLFDHRKALSLGVTFVATVMVFVTFGAMFMFAIIRIKFGMNQIFSNRLYRGTTAVGERLSRSNSLNCESPYRENVQTRVGNRLALNGPGQNKENKTSLPSSSKKFPSNSSGKLFSGALMTSKMSRIKKSEEIRAALLDNVGLGEYEGGALTPPSPLQDDLPPVILRTRSSFDDVVLACDDTCIDLDDRTLETCQDCNNLLVGNLQGDSGIHVSYRESPSLSSSGNDDLYQSESPRLDHRHHHHSHSVLSEDSSFARIFNATEDLLDSGSRCVSDCSGIPDDYNFSNFPTTTSCPLTKNFRGPHLDEVYDNVPGDVLVLGSSPLDGRRYAQ